MRSLPAISILLLALTACDDWGSNLSGRRDSDSGDKCWPIPHDLAPGSIRCWSGGELVYSNHIYHNGGVLCSIEGKEIKITGGKSLCVIESDQDSSWEPPIAAATER